MFHGDINMISAIFPLDFSRSDAFLYRTYVQAQVATNAIVVEFRSSLFFVPVDSLVSCIVAGDVASAASEALLITEVRQDLEVSVEFFCRDEVRQCTSDEFIEAVVSSLIHEMHKS